MKRLSLIIIALFQLFYQGNCQTEVSDVVFGDWTKEASPYLVTNDIIVEENSELIIGPGVQVVFQGYFSLTINGKLLILGNENDSVLFTVNDSTGFADFNSNSGAWGGIQFDSEAHETNLFRFCKFQFAKNAYSGGGAIRFDTFKGVLDISHCTFKNNYATSGGALRYDGAYKGPLLIRNTRFDSNFANNGGAICAWSYNNLEEISNCIFINNHATNNGGALYIQATGTKFFNCLFKNNTSTISGGAIIHGSTSNIDMYNCIFDSNESTTGAAFSTFAGAFGSNIINCTFINNISDNSVVEFADDYDQVTVVNTIVWNSYSPEITINPDISSINIENSLIQDATDSIWFSESCFDQEPEIIETDLGYSLETTSPCIDNGNNTFLNPSIKVDFLNNCRLWNSGENSIGKVDIGAIESNSQDSLPNNTLKLIGDTLDEGSNFTFIISEDYIEQYTYTWFHGSDTIDCDSNILSLTNIVRTQAGYYSCLVSNEYGEVLSNVANLKVLLVLNPPNLTSPNNGEAGVGVWVALGWSSVIDNSGYLYQLDTTPDFTSSLLVEGASPVNSSQINVSDLYYGTTYYWRVATKTTVDTSAWTETWNFTTSYAVSNTSPADGSQNEAVSLALDWEDIIGSSSYLYQLDTTPDFTSPLLVEGTISSFYSQFDVYNLYFGTTYYWRVAAKNAVDTSAWTETWNFTTSYAVSNTSPADGSQNEAVSLALDWEDIIGSSSYLYQLDTTPDFTSPLLVEGTISSFYSQFDVYNLYFGTTYYWRVAAKNAVDTSNWSMIWSFKTERELANSPSLVSPMDNSTGIGYPSALVEWGSCAGASFYQYQYSYDADFSEEVYSNTTSLLTSTLTELQPQTVYYWRVRGGNTTDYSEWSDVWQFTTDSIEVVPPELVSPLNNAVEVSHESLTLNWSPVIAATDYTYEISVDNYFLSSISSNTVAETHCDLLVLEPYTEYYWRVKALGGGNESDWSEVWSFTTTQDVSIPMYEIEDVLFYPNPAEKHINIVWEGFNRIEILDSKGIIIMSIHNNVSTIDISDLSSGMYYFRIRTSESITVKKLIIR